MFKGTEASLHKEFSHTKQETKWMYSPKEVQAVRSQQEVIPSEITQSYYTALSELDQRLWKLLVIVSDDEWSCFVKTEAYLRYYVINWSMAYLLQVVLSNIQKVPF